jgi:hypothetical protein
VPVNWQITWHTIPLLNELMQKDHAIAVVRRKVGIRLRLRCPTPQRKKPVSDHHRSACSGVKALRNTSDDKRQSR